MELFEDLCAIRTRCVDRTIWATSSAASKWTSSAKYIINSSLLTPHINELGQNRVKNRICLDARKTDSLFSTRWYRKEMWQLRKLQSFPPIKEVSQRMERAVGGGQHQESHRETEMEHWAPCAWIVSCHRPPQLHDKINHLYFLNKSFWAGFSVTTKAS